MAKEWIHIPSVFGTGMQEQWILRLHERSIASIMPNHDQREWGYVVQGSDNAVATGKLFNTSKLEAMRDVEGSVRDMGWML